jgi:hypothetical protein
MFCTCIFKQLYLGDHSELDTCSYVLLFSLKMTDTVTSNNIVLSSWITLYSAATYVYASFQSCVGPFVVHATLAFYQIGLIRISDAGLRVCQGSFLTRIRCYRWANLRVTTLHYQAVFISNAKFCNFLNRSYFNRIISAAVLKVGLCVRVKATKGVNYEGNVVLVPEAGLRQQ